MVVLPILAGLLWLLYAGLILYLHGLWNKVPRYTAGSAPSSIRFSILIPARNEAQHIGHLLTAISQQQYDPSLFEVIVIDDDSEDETVAVVGRFPGVRCLPLEPHGSNAYKKMALTQGIRESRFEWTITTDADCLPGPFWLATLASFIQQQQPQWVVAPVRMKTNGSLLSMFQALDFMTLQGITAAGVHSGTLNMCNGANLAYPKSAFQAVRGFEGIDQIASGDDMLLMQKITRAFPGSARYLLSPDAIVLTEPAPDWRSFIQQRIRWASKATYYEDKGMKAVLLLVYLLNLSILGFFLLGIFDRTALWTGVGLLLGKILVEYPFVYALSRFFGYRNGLLVFPFLQPLHILYTVLAGAGGWAGRYEWKGRRVR